MSEIKTQAEVELEQLRSAFASNSPEQVLPYMFKLTTLLRNDLSAKDYYELFLQILDGLLEFSFYLSSFEVNIDLLNQASHAIEIVPRLYTMISVGIKLYEANICPDILDELIELVKGVQHPLRGLFLRYYLNKSVKNLHKENSRESIEFLLKNLAVMNSMWSRIDDVQQREALKITVGENVERLSVVCTDTSLYFDLVFPRLMEILNTSDLTSQKYLLDCVIQAFPDDFLLKTFDEFIEIACEIQTVCDVISLIYYTLERLLRFTQENGIRIEQKSLIPLNKYLNCVLNTGNKENLIKKIEVHSIFLKFSVNDEYKIDNMVNTLANLQVMLDNNTENLSYSDIILEILCDSIQIDLVESVSSSNFNRAYCELSEIQKSKLAMNLYNKLDFAKLPESLEFWNHCFSYLKFLMISNDLLNSRLKINKIIKCLVWSYEIVQIAFEKLSDDETFAIFIAFTGLAELKNNIVYKSLVKLCIDRIQNTFIAFQVCANSIISFSSLNLDTELAELVSKAIQLYENLFDHSSKTLVFHSLVTIAMNLSIFPGFIEKVVGICYKIPKKTEQCIALLSLSHIYWSEKSRNPGKLLDNLKRSVKLADLCVAGSKNLNLFVMILNEYILFSLYEVPSIDVLSINSLIELIFELISQNTEQDAELSLSKTYMKNTLRFASIKQKEGKLKDVTFSYDYDEKLN